MSKPKETAAERRAREAAEARVAQEAWEISKPMRLLQALARAQDLGIEGCRVRHRKDGVLCYEFYFTDYNTYADPVEELSEWTMQCIENDLQEIQAERHKQQHLREVREKTLATLTDEQKEALGLR
jgi:hypothetical protein